MQNISGGVGEAYPGSTGGEIFNSYEGTNRNQASGSYSTAVGVGNKTYGSASFTFGSNNSNEGTYCIVGGVNNIMPNTGSYRCIFGGFNRLQYPGFVIGYNNNSSGYIIGENNTNGYSTTINGILIGYGLLHRNQRNNYSTPDKVIAIGQYNASTALASPILMIGCGRDTLNPKNALEINASSCKILNNLQLGTDNTEVNAIDPPRNSAFDSLDQTLATLGTFMKRYQAWETSIVFTPDTPKTATDMPSGFLSALYEAAEAEFTGTYYGVQVRAKFRLTPISTETLLVNPVICYNTDGGAYSHSRGFILKLEKSSSAVTITMQQGTSIDFGNNDNTFNSYVDSTTTFDVSYIQLKMTNF